MSFAPGSGNPGTTFNIYSQPGYSSASDVEGSNITDYSDHETGYSSTTSTGGFEFISPTTQFQPSPRIPPYVRGYTPTSSTSPSAPLYTTVSPQQSNVTSPTTSGGGQPTTQYQRIARFVGPPPVALACTECRSRHLKCDAGTPSCSRCLADKRECNYIKSRRGWKGTRRKKSTAAAASNSATTEAKEGDAKNSAVKSGTDTEGPEVLASKSNAPASATGTLCPFFLSLTIEFFVDAAFMHFLRSVSVSVPLGHF